MNEWTSARNLFFNLLIEPVWNRNLSLHPLRVKTRSLLIEPVWNRNRQNTLRKR